MQIKLAELMKLPILKPFSKKAEAMIDPYQALTDHITDMRSRMEQVQQRLESNPLPKVAGKDENDSSELSIEQVFEDVAMGLDLLESKLKDEPESEELHRGLEELENLLWETEQKAGITPKLSEEEREEPEHKDIVEEVEKESSEKGRKPRSLVHKEYKEELTKDELEDEPVEKEAAANEWPLCSVEGCNNKADSVAEGKRYCYKHSWGKENLKEAALPVAITPTLSNPAPAANATPAVTPDDKKTSCALCGGMTFPDFTAYQQHMEYTHAGDTMPTTPAQKKLPTTAAVQVTDETIEEGTGIPPATPAVTPAPVIQNVQPTDQDNLEVPVAAPTSPAPQGQKWIYNPDVMAYVLMPDPSAPNKTI
jgi:hypothetical protein